MGNEVCGHKGGGTGDDHKVWKGLSKYVLKKIVEYMESISFAAGQLVG